MEKTLREYFKIDYSFFLLSRLRGFCSFFLDSHSENLVGFLEVKPTKEWRPPSVSGSYIQPPAIHIYHLGTNVWLLWLLFQVIGP